MTSFADVSVEPSIRCLMNQLSAYGEVSVLAIDTWQEKAQKANSTTGAFLLVHPIATECRESYREFVREVEVQVWAGDTKFAFDMATQISDALHRTSFFNSDGEVTWSERTGGPTLLPHPNNGVVGYGFTLMLSSWD